MEAMKIPADSRSETGKGYARGLRREGRIPAVVYGKGKPPMSLSVAPTALLGVLASAHGRNTVLELEVGQEKVLVLLTDYQYHPVSRSLLHADFIRINLDEPVAVEVPFELVGKARGLTMGGELHKVFRKLPISCLPANIPVKIEYDVTEMELDDHIPASKLPLPEGVAVRLPPNQTVCALVTEKKVVEATEAGAEGAAAAAAPAAAP